MAGGTEVGDGGQLEKEKDRSNSNTGDDFDEKRASEEYQEADDAKVEESIALLAQGHEIQSESGRGESQESKHQAPNEQPTAGKPGTEDTDEKDESVDEEVRSIIDQFQDTTLGDRNEEHRQYAQELEQEMLGEDSIKSKHNQETSQSTSKTDAQPDASHVPESPSASRPTNLTPDLHRKSLPPAPELELRFNFHLFLEQLKHRTADPVARYLRSFLIEFAKKQWNVQEQVRIISDFLTFISGKMLQCEVWARNSESEFDNAKEGMEKLVMTRLYSQTFSPELPPPATITDVRGRKRAQKPAVTGRRGQHQEDVERDRVLAEKMQIFSWVEEQHLDVPPVPPESRRFLSLAQQEISKINNYRAPRDKVICILNACKVIFGLLKTAKGADTSADSFMPLLIYTVLRARPRHMVSNSQYIFRFRNQEKLGGEAGYYLSSLMGAVQFIESLDRTALTISNEDFERHVEAAVAAIAERQAPPAPTPALLEPALLEPKKDREVSTSRSPSRLLATDGAGPVQDIIRNIQRPLSNLGRMFSDEPNDQRSTREADAGPAPTISTSGAEEPRAGEGRPQRRLQPDVDVNNIVETLASMFPTLDKDVISDIVIAKQARVGAAVDACLSLTS